MAQEHESYKVLLELKETAGSTASKIDDIKESIAEQAIKHEKLVAEHRELRDSHNSYKGKILLVSGFVGSIFGGITTWFYKTFVDNQ